MDIYHEGPPHWPKGCKVLTLYRTTPDQKQPHDIGGNLTVCEVDVSSFEIKYIECTNITEPMEVDGLTKKITEAANAASKKTIDVFQISIAKSRSFPKEKGINLKTTNTFRSGFHT